MMRYSDSGNGITADSLAFYREHRHRLGRIVTAAVRFPGFSDPRDPYLMVLFDCAGNELRLSGCTSGYPGEGPRGALHILIAEGWPAATASRVLSAATVCLSRDDPAPSSHSGRRAGVLVPLETRPRSGRRRGIAIEQRDR
jgi:hypothetical protein